MSKGVSKSVAIIGGGSAGIATCRFLKAAGHRIRLLDAGSTFGGIWAPQPSNDVVYNNLTTNLPTVVMQSFDVDFSAKVPSYVTPTQLGEYLESYAEFSGAAENAELGATVTAVSRCRDGWEVSWEKGGQHHCEEFDCVAVANGHFNKPYMPKIPGQDEWLSGDSRRRVLHARDYREPTAFAGVSVLVVGGRSSGVDIARELRSTVSSLYVLAKGGSQVFREGHCAYVPVGASLRRDGYLQLEGGVVEGAAVDVVLLATGYQYEFPFLDTDSLGMRVERYVTPMYLHCLHATFPTLAFIGLPQSVPCPITAFEAQARYIAAFWAGKVQTSEQDRYEWVEARKAQVGERMQDMHMTGDTTWSYIVDLIRLSGVQGEELDRIERRVSVVQEIYRDRVSKQSKIPWGDDW
eukprot:CAMPEP_0204309142 /NCGR_PEP_ID=MMETSP0469-20131031/928_1 /ASSEMBLY_ACC=CAM_ASM_000384 /TAXON_ID=2969 /ORGANISM="Oxyrrhis marina" /LENGTH=406 /DNA_ID=CAMNT_0051288727 /DNA_START=1 /DNA_END=1218 /DNA_ORIENTATION=+